MTTWTIGHFANVAKGLALAAGTIFGMWMVWQWWQRTLRLWAVEREATAKRHYAAFLEKALEHPELARPPAGGPAAPRERAQYQWFVGFLLTKAEEILLANPTPAWRESIGRQLRYHRDYLASPAFRDGPQRASSSELQRLIEEACAGEPAGQPASPHLREVVRR